MPITIDNLRNMVSQEDYHREPDDWVCEVVGIDGSLYCGDPAPWIASGEACDEYELYDNGKYLCEEHYIELGRSGVKKQIKIVGEKIERRLPR